MRLSFFSYRRAGCCILFITAILLTSLSGSPQSSQIERIFPTTNFPRVLISNASQITIESWDKNVVSIKGEVLGSAVQSDEVSIKGEDNKINVSCRSAKPERKIFLTVRVPSKSILEISTDGNKVEVREPTDQMVISYASKELIQLNAPEETRFDMQDAPNASVRRSMPQGGSVVFSIGRSRTGTGPPYVKVAAAKPHVAITLGFNNIITRTPTLAATTIARRDSSMGLALRRSAPELIRRSSRVEQPGDPKPTDREEGALKLETYLVNLNVSATDRAGRAIPDLKKEDFSVYEDGVLQRTSFFSPQRSPFNLVLLIDLSGSMRDEIDNIKGTAMHFLDIISSTDSVAMVTFSTDVVVVSQLTRDRDDLRDSIDYMLPPVGGTAFYDALGYALVETLRKVKGQRNAVIAITDGEDNALQAQLYFRPANISIAAGSFLTFEELLDGAKEADALIYPIHLDPALPQLITPPNIRTSPGAPTPRVQIQTNTDRQKLLASALTDLAKEQLHALADASGGRFYHANRIDDLKGVFEQVAAELRTVYSMAYTPTNLNFDGRFRRIKVQVNRPEVVIRTRPGYYGR